MSTGTIETTFAGGAGGDEPYIEQGIRDAESLLRLELAFQPGEFVLDPVVFAPGALGVAQRSRRTYDGIHTGRIIFHGRQIIPITPKLANNYNEEQ